jgi:hypothetical protein
MLLLVLSLLIFVAREQRKSDCCNKVATFGSSFFRKLPSRFTPEIIGTEGIQSLTQDIQVKSDVQNQG